MKPIEHPIASDELIETWQKRKHRGRVAFGLVLVALAALLILKELGMLTAGWLLSWPMIFVAFGFISLIKNGFRHPAWIFMFGIGAFFLSGMLYPEFLIQKFILPAVLAFAGLLFIFRRKGSCRGPNGFYRFRHGRKQYGAYQEISSTEDELHINNSYSGVKRSVISKDFKGGEIRNHLGGCELNLMRAEIQSQATIVIDQHMGGIKLIVPSHWRIQSEVNCTMATVEDQRGMMPSDGPEGKVLVLKGNVFMEAWKLFRIDFVMKAAIAKLIFQVHRLPETVNKFEFDEQVIVLSGDSQETQVKEALSWAYAYVAENNLVPSDGLRWEFIGIREMIPFHSVLGHFVQAVYLWKKTQVSLNTYD